VRRGWTPVPCAVSTWDWPHKSRKSARASGNQEEK
jgi:hypothetical protein